MILKQREILAKENLLSKPKEYLLKGLFFNKYLFDMALNTAGFFQKLVFSNKTEIDNLPEPLSDLTSFRTLPKFADKSLKKRISKENIVQDSDAQKEILGFFSGCLIDRFYPEEGINAIRILQDLGYKIDHPEDQTCCGIPALYSGDVELYKKSLDENIKAFKNTESKYFKGVFTLCPSCTYGLKKESAFRDAEIYDFSEFIYNNVDSNRLKLKGFKNITYHPSCHHSRDSYNKTYTHLILERLAGNNFISYSDMYNCCGAAGSYAVEYPEISEKIIMRKVENILESGAKIIVVDCPGCKMQIDGYLKKNNIDLQTLFITEVIEVQ